MRPATQSEAVQALESAGWVACERSCWIHDAHPGHVIAASPKSEAWTHSVRYSTGYKILGRGHSDLAGHLARSKSLNVR